MRNRKNSLRLVVAGLVLCSPAFADSKESISAKDHNCNLPANVRNKVEHCNQVGDFGASERDPKGSTRIEHRKMTPHQWHRAPNLPVDGTGPKQKSDKPSKNAKDAKTDQMLEIKSDSEPTSKEK